jgi:hypothetical protein
MDKKIREIDIMVTLLEAKLNSLPVDITSKYPEQVHCSIDDITPEIIINNTGTQSVNVSPIKSYTKPASQEIKLEEVIKAEEIAQPVEVIEEVVVEEPKEETPEDKLRAFIETHGEEMEKLHKMLRYGVPGEAVIQKAMFSGSNVDLVKVVLINNPLGVNRPLPSC